MLDNQAGGGVKAGAAYAGDTNDNGVGPSGPSNTKCAVIGALYFRIVCLSKIGHVYTSKWTIKRIDSI